MSNLFIREVWQKIFGMGRENVVWVIQTPYPANLDPLDEALRHLRQTLLDLSAKDLSAW